MDEEMDIIELNELAPDDAIQDMIKNLGLSAKDESSDNDEIRESLMNGELKISRTIENIPLSELVEVDDSINFFALPDDEEFIELAHSIETYGVINPIIVMKHEDSGKYVILIGRSRYIVVKSLYATSKLEKYSTIPCIILDSSTDPSLIQGMIISSNLKYRKVPRETLIKSIFTLDNVLKKNKRNKNEMNIANTIARRAGISRTTVNNYMAFKSLSPLAMELVNNRFMNLKIAKILSKQDHEKQKFIIETLENNINDLPKVMSLIQGPGKAILDEKTKQAVPDNWERTIEFTKKMVPPIANLTIKLPCEAVGECLEIVLDFKNKFAFKNNYTNRAINRVFKIKSDERIMEQYVNRGYVKEEVFEKIKRKKNKEEFKLSSFVGL